MIRNILLALLVSYSIFVECSEEIRKVVEDGAHCRGHDIEVSEKDMATILECASELGIKSKSDITADKMPCFSRCLIEKQGLIDHDGTPHKEKIIKVELESNLPDDLKEDIRKHLGECLDKYGPQAKADDKTCKSFEPLTTYLRYVKLLI